eukprot:scpid61937/ scgid32052/ 
MAIAARAVLLLLCTLWTSVIFVLWARIPISFHITPNIKIAFGLATADINLVGPNYDKRDVEDSAEIQDPSLDLHKPVHLWRRNFVSEGEQDQRRRPSRQVIISEPQTRKDGTNDHPLVAVGSFTEEQLSMSCNMFSDFLATAAALHRDVVMPHALGRFFTGMAGFNYTDQYGLTRKCCIADSVLPRPLEDYYNLTHVRLYMARNQIKPQTEAFAEQTCGTQWTILFLFAPEWKYWPHLCHSRRDLMPKVKSTFGMLRNSTDPKLAVDMNCEWMLECLPWSVRRMMPFRHAICATVPDKYAKKWTMANVAQQINGISSRCLLLMHWFGLQRHGLRGTPAMRLNDFTSSSWIQNSAKHVIAKSPLSAGFVAAHIRMEHLFLHCGPKPKIGPYICASGKSLMNFTSNCFQEYFKQLKDTSRFNLPLLISHDAGTSSTFTKQKKVIMTPERHVGWLVAELKHSFGRIILLPELFQDPQATFWNDDVRQITLNQGLKSLLDAEILVSASSLSVLGGGSYQHRIWRIRKQRAKTIETDTQMCDYFQR